MSAPPLNILAILTFSSLVVSTGCSKPSPQAQAERDPQVSDEAPLDQAKPTMKMEPTPTADTSLGTLPEGVGVAVGQPAPDAKILDFEGKPMQLLDVVGSKPTLVVFYRGGWCPFCNSQIHQLTKAYPKFQERGITIAAISVDRADESAKTKATYTIPFPVLSDPDLDAHQAYRVTHEVSQPELEKLRGFGINLEAASGRTHHTIAIPSMFLIDSQGAVRWAHADKDYKVRPATDSLLAAIDGVGLEKP
ncbi:Peroxiredoxin [Enhygromyxa salina]|uniref:Peroxiredoxin n=1 Tax=Enhygromyxa salina TaxID=215803 RepID=A0A0C2DID9_9BACT|nr:peroxiredoxin family protein [Enhygromyxa salina]KIG19432.1 Peroxiredoxin [Enhygromyxa salina]